MATVTGAEAATVAATVESAGARATTSASNAEGDEEHVAATLLRLTQGIPRAELKLVVSEAAACEVELAKEIELLQKALEDPASSENNPQVNALLDSVLTPMDHYWTVSALLGRLRDNLLLPRIPTAGNVPPFSNAPPATATSRNVPIPASELLSLHELPAYTQKHEQPTQLLALYKKLSSHRSAYVFRKPVKDEEAPGYSDRIRFRMDLGLVRRLITAGYIASYRDFHMHTALISHNCVKFNGRESDYGIIAREFEQVADEMVLHAVINGTVRKTSPPPTAADDPQTKKPPTGQNASSEQRVAAKDFSSETAVANPDSNMTS